MLSPVSFEFGTMTALLSGVRMLVVNRAISSTVPASPAPMMKSPTLKGRKMISMMPAAKFDSEPCKAKPTARPAAPMMAIKDVVWIPIWPRAASTTTTIRIAYVTFPPNLTSVGSIALLDIMRSTRRRSTFAARCPTSRMISTHMRLSPYLAPYSRMTSPNLSMPSSLG